MAATATFSDKAAALHAVCRALLSGQTKPETHCRNLHCTADGTLVSCALEPCADLGVTFCNTWILDTCAVVEYQTSVTSGYMMALQPTAGWTVVCHVFVDNKPDEETKITPVNLVGPATACWDEYCAANRACDGTAMAKIFHEQSRLMFVNEEGNIVQFSSLEFCQKVQDRYQREPHAQYAAWKDQIDVVSACDTLQGCSMICPNLALVRLRVAHPPFLWSDLLICAKLAKENDKWWIVAKCSDHEEFIPT